MNYKGKVVGLTGSNGFIGSQLYKRLEEQGAYINVLTGDVRDPETFAGVNYEYDYIFHFADPSSQVLFKRQAQYAADVTIKGFINAADACQKHGVKLIYPSTGLLSQDKMNAYARCKLICEHIAEATGLDSTGIRIFATYGPGEAHKRDYASVPYLFARDVINGARPLVFGDGEQVRDFIYIDDVVEAVLHIAEECNDLVIDVGSGEPISFKDILRELVVLAGEEVYPLFVPAPLGYVSETLASTEELHKYYKPKVTFAQGIAQVIKKLKEEKS